MGCAQNNAPTSPPPSNELRISPQLTLGAVESTEQIFALNEHAKAQLDAAFAQRKDDLDATQALIMILLNSGSKSLRYNSSATLTAMQTYEQLNANCLSLSILAYSMANHLGLKAQFQRVHIPEYWDLEQDYNLLTGHVNLRLEMPVAQKVGRVNAFALREFSIVDFAPDLGAQGFDTTVISPRRIAAMFYNNKGAQALLDKDYEKAHSYLIAATSVDPFYSGGWGNLGILHRQLEDFERAEHAYQYALSLDNHNYTALGNLAILYRLTERDELAVKIDQQLRAIRADNPFYHIALGNEELIKKQYQKALAHYRQARNLNNQLHQVYFAMARTYYLLDDFDNAQANLIKAHKLADYDYDKKRYQGKLSALNLYASQTP